MMVEHGHIIDDDDVNGVVTVVAETLFDVVDTIDAEDTAVVVPVAILLVDGEGVPLVKGVELGPVLVREEVVSVVVRELVLTELLDVEVDVEDDFLLVVLVVLEVVTGSRQHHS